MILAIDRALVSKSPTGYKYSKEFLKRMNTNNSRFTNVFIKNFKDLLDDFKLWKLCKQFGEVTSAKVMVDEYGISKGFGFACFTDSDAAQREWRSPHSSISNTSGGGGGGGGGLSNPGQGFNNGIGSIGLGSCSPRICVRNLRDLVDDIRLRKEFERFGPVLHAELLKNFDGTSKGVGYVIYKDQTDATKALTSMHGKVIYGTRISVTYAPYTTTTATNTIPDNSCPINYLQPSNSGSGSGGAAAAAASTNDAGSSCISNSNDTHTEASSPTGTSGGKNGDGDTDNNASNDGDNNSSSKSLLKLKDLVSTLANKGHPVNINDISNFGSSSSGSNSGSNSVNRNSSNNSDNINTSNNAILALTAARKASTRDVTAGKRSTSAQTSSTSVHQGTSSSTKDNDNAMDNDNNDDDDNNDMNYDGSSSSSTIRQRRVAPDVGSDDCDDPTSQTATLSVKNLEESITDEKLESLFSVYGHVVSAKVISNEFGASKGFGFVIMAEAQDAVRAIKNLDGRIVVNRPVYVAPTGQPRTLAKA
ncbi:polyadenylate-binding protein [Plakobranchus ocellatus]|uniref:Polyadenylate-binding protein n=1 Tax=Plakobranchus ocellatus TaxID=259542 RepID=A0AAV4CRF7_9GAST|nr:polyadenylate-binding protein [Plakobranchus ocellatus]